MLTDRRKTPPPVPVSKEHCQHKPKLFVLGQSLLGKIILFPCMARRTFRKKQRFEIHKQQQQQHVNSSASHSAPSSCNMSSGNHSATPMNPPTMPKLTTTDWIFRTGWTPQPDPLALLDSGWCNHCYSHTKKDLPRCPTCGMHPLTLLAPYISRGNHNNSSSDNDRKKQKRLSEIEESEYFGYSSFYKC